MVNLKKLVIKINEIDFPVVFKNNFPDNYINDVEGWGLSEELLHTKLHDGAYKLLTLDLDFGNKCRLSCPHCFKSNKNIDASKSLSFDEVIRLLKDAKKLGLKYVKILGAGEPFDNPDFLDFLIKTYDLGIKVAVFTKGYVIGSNKLTKSNFHSYGIQNSKELVNKLYELNVSILLSFNSFDDGIQGEFVGIKSPKRLNDYISSRNRALKLLIDRGFNKFIEGKATKLALIVAPIKPSNINEVFDIYKFGRIRNIYVAVCPTTYSGLGKEEYKRQNETINFEEFINRLKKLYINIYKWNINNNLMTLDTFIKEGVSLYAGAHPCNQVAGGMYITLNGKVLRCPGRDNKSHTVINDVREKDLKDIWINSKNYDLAKDNKFNYHCIARDKKFLNEHNFYTDIYNAVIKHFRHG